MKLRSLAPFAIALFAAQAQAAHWILVSEANSAVTWTAEQAVNKAFSANVTDTAAITGGVYGSQSITYYGFSLHVTYLSEYGLTLTGNAAASGSVSYVFQYVFDSPDDPTPTVGENLSVLGYNIRTDGVTNTGGPDVPISGSASFSHVFSATNSFTIDDPYGGDPWSPSTSPWPLNASPADSYTVTGTSGSLYDYTTAAWDAPVTETAGVYYATLTAPYSTGNSINVTEGWTDTLKWLNGDTDLLGVAQIGGFAVQY